MPVLQKKKLRIREVKFPEVTCLESIRGLEYRSDRDSKPRPLPPHLAASNLPTSSWDFR